jgi:hypothetical protein
MEKGKERRFRKLGERLEKLGGRRKGIFARVFRLRVLV